MVSRIDMLIISVIVFSTLCSQIASFVLHTPSRRAHFSLRSYSDDDFDDDDDDYIELPNSKMASFSSNPIAFGPGKGKSAPSQRKAMGKSSASSATVHVCTNCSAEYVNWVGKCSTCNEWNTIQEFKVNRNKATPGGAKPVFQRMRPNGGNMSEDSRPASWLSGVEDDGLGGSGEYGEYQPVSIQDVYKKMGYNKEKRGNGSDDDNDFFSNYFEKRVQIPDDEELNNVLGGGIMPGSLILLGGDPGVGKSTLLLQAAGQIASLSEPPRKIGYGKESDDGKKIGPVLYVSGEENSIQIASRAMRLGIDESELLLMCETSADYIAETVANYANDAQMTNYDIEDDESSQRQPSGVLGRRRQPSLVIIDSIQTMICDNGGNSSPGGVTQVRECGALFLRLAKATGVPIVLVGHVTKAGGVAGPRTLEHLVDVILYLEGSTLGGGTNLRMLRASKNRFGSSDEVGVYSSSNRNGGRLLPVSDPSSLLLANRIDSEDVEGCAISLVLEGIRPMTVEVQALVTNASPPSYVGRRTVDGISYSRLQLILAVLQKRCGISFSRQDVYVNVVGGINLGQSKQDGSSSDLAIAVALVSSLYNIPIRSDTAFCGEIGLLGELRQVQAIEKRVNEARRMGFSSVVVPKQYRDKPKGKWQKSYSENTKSLQSMTRGITCIEAESLRDAIQKGLTEKIPNRKKSKGKKQKYGNQDKKPPVFEDDEFIIDDDEDYDDELDFQ